MDFFTVVRREYSLCNFSCFIIFKDIHFSQIQVDIYEVLVLLLLLFKIFSAT